MSKRRALLFALCIMAGPVLAGPPLSGARPPLTLCYEDVAQRPWTMPNGTGLALELIKRVEKQLGEQFIYAAKPWKRCMEELRLGAVDAVVGAADARERRAFASYPLLPDGASDPARALYADAANVYLRVGGRASWDGQQLLSPASDIAVQSGYLVASQMRERGYRVRELVKSADDGLRLLTSGMFDAAVLEGHEASTLVRTDPRFQGHIVQATPPYIVMPLYLTFNRGVYQRDPQRVDAIWKAIAAVRQSEGYRALLAEAGVAD